MPEFRGRRRSARGGSSAKPLLNPQRTVEQMREAASMHRLGKVSFRLHAFLRGAFEHLAAKDRRSLSSYIEIVLLDHARERLENKFDHIGGPANDAELGKPWRTRRR